MVRVRSYTRRRPKVLYRGSSSRNITKRGLERTAGIPFMPSTKDPGIAEAYAGDHVLYQGGKPIVVKFKTEGLKIEEDPALGGDFHFQWNVLEDRIPKKNIIEVREV